MAHDRFFSWLVHLGFALTGAAWLVRDILLLRLLAIASYLVFSLFLLTTQTSPSLTYLGWYALPCRSSQPPTRRLTRRSRRSTARRTSQPPTRRLTGRGG